MISKDMELTEGIRRRHAAKHTLPFRQYRKTSGRPYWTAAAGYVAVSDGSPKDMVCAGMLFGITVRGGKPELDSFWLTDFSPDLPTVRPYTLKALKAQIQRGRTEPMFKGLDARAVCNMVRPTYPELRIPSNEEWAREFGIRYSTEANRFEL